MAGDRFDYTEALARSRKEQMLLNMVKVRYMDLPVFLDVQQVVQQYTFEKSGTVSAVGSTDTTFTGGVAASGRWAESPTITYLPMSGEKFTKSLMQPVAPANLFSLVQGGWPVDAVFAITVKVINGLHSGSRSGFDQPADPDFYRLLVMLRELQNADAFGLRVEKTKEGEGGIVVFRAREADEKAMATARKVREMLHLSPQAQEFSLAYGAVAQSDKEIAMLTRSMLGILMEASAGVEVPDSDLAEGRVQPLSVLDDASGLRPRFSIRVRSSTSKPDAGETFAAVRYRNYWFWLDDRDVPSKRGLDFLMLLFTMLESGTSPTPPLLTISRP